MYYKQFWGLSALRPDQVALAQQFIQANFRNPAAIAGAARQYGITVAELVDIVSKQYPESPQYGTRPFITKYFSDAGIRIGYDDIPDPAGTFQKAPATTATPAAVVTPSTAITPAHVYSDSDVQTMMQSNLVASVNAARAQGASGGQLVFVARSAIQQIWDQLRPGQTLVVSPGIQALIDQLQSGSPTTPPRAADVLTPLPPAPTQTGYSQAQLDAAIQSAATAAATAARNAGATPTQQQQAATTAAQTVASTAQVLPAIRSTAVNYSPAGVMSAFDAIPTWAKVGAAILAIKLVL